MKMIINAHPTITVEKLTVYMNTIYDACQYNGTGFSTQTFDTYRQSFNYYIWHKPTNNELIEYMSVRGRVSLEEKHMDFLRHQWLTTHTSLYQYRSEVFVEIPSSVSLYSYLDEYGDYTFDELWWTALSSITLSVSPTRPSLNFFIWIGEYIRSHGINHPDVMPDDDGERQERKNQREQIFVQYHTKLKEIIVHGKNTTKQIQKRTWVSSHIADVIGIRQPLQTTLPLYQQTDTIWGIIKTKYINGEDHNSVYDNRTVTLAMAQTLASHVHVYQSEYDTTFAENGDVEELILDQSPPRKWVVEFAEQVKNNPDKTFMAFLFYHGGEDGSWWPLSKQEIHLLAKSWPNLILFIPQCYGGAVFDNTVDGVYAPVNNFTATIMQLSGDHVAIGNDAIIQALSRWLNPFEMMLYIKHFYRYSLVNGVCGGKGF